jgi:putative phage-type endonuclease
MEDRKLYIGGSDVAAILGFNKYRSPLDVFFEKRGLISSDENENEYIYWGTKLEPLIAEKFCKKTKAIVTRDMPIKYHPDYNFLAAHIDGFIPEQNAILECKNIGLNNKNKWGEEFTDEIPEQYLCQVAHYSLIYQPNIIYIAVLFGGNDFKVYTYHPNKKFENTLLEKLLFFWNENIIKNIPPLPRNLEEIKKIYPIGTEKKVISADNNLLTIYENSLKLVKQKEELELSIETHKTSLANYMKDAEILLDNSGDLLATFKNRIIHTIDSKALKTEQPEIHAQFLKENVSRVFMLKK